MTVCEMCGKPATQFTADLQEISEQNGVRAWDPIGGRRARCRRHARRPEKWKLRRNEDGTPAIRDGEYIREQEL